jgi:hypothetical protein
VWDWQAEEDSGPQAFKGIKMIHADHMQDSKEDASFTGQGWGGSVSLN